jgi:hypothetical protein
VKQIVSMGVPPLNAAAYVEVFNKRSNTAGTTLSMAAALKAWKESQSKAAPTEPDIETDDGEREELDESVNLADRVENDEVAADEAERHGLSLVDSSGDDHESAAVPAEQEGAAETVSKPAPKRRAR